MKLSRDLLQNCRGGASVEFALILPILVGVLILSIEGWNAVRHALDMHAGVQSGVRYLQGGGRDDEELQAISLASWPRRTSDGVITASRICKCGGAVIACTAICPDGAAPAAFVTVRGQTIYRGMVGNLPLEENGVLRVR